MAKAFKMQLNGFLGKARADADKRMQDLVTEVYNNVLSQSPHPGNSKKGYSKGSYALSHRIAIGAIDPSFTMVPREVTDAIVQAQAELAKVPQIKAGDVVFISNSVPHSPRVEHGGWDYKNGGTTPYNTYKKALVLSKAKIRTFK